MKMNPFKKSTEVLAKPPLQETAREDARPPNVQETPDCIMEGERPRELASRFACVSAEKITVACSGVTLVEMLVTLLLVMIVAVGLSTAISAALSIEQRYREESDIRTALALQMDYAERYFSLATSITNQQTAAFRQETDGISMETGHWNRVSGVTLSTTNNVLNFRITSNDSERHDAVADREFSADSMLRASLVQTNATRCTYARLEGDGTVRRLVLKTDFLEKVRTNTVAGTRMWLTTVTRTNTISVERPIRMWNKD